MPKPSKSVARETRRDKRLRARNDSKLIATADFSTPRISVKGKKTDIRPLTDAQRDYDAAIRSSEIVFGIGPAGTGKTWLATMRAAEALDKREIERIVITRPAVEAGESLGFLPGELEDKYEPYIRPVRDALEEFFGTTHLEYLLKSGKIEARPLGLIRGSTFKNCWVLLDEAQNTSPAQMKMFLSRIGENAKLIVEGDPRQKDIPGASGLTDAVERFDGVNGISVVEFRKDDIVRSGMCRIIIEGYDR